jgi:hypothetical protein
MTGRSRTRSVHRRAAALGAATVLTTGGTVLVAGAAFATPAPVHCPQQADGTYVCTVTHTGKTVVAVPIAIDSFSVRLVGGTGGTGGGGGGAGGTGGVTEGTVTQHFNAGDLLDVFVGANGHHGASCAGGDGTGGTGGNSGDADTFGGGGGAGGDAVCTASQPMDATRAQSLRTATSLGGGGGGGAPSAVTPDIEGPDLAIAGGGGGGAGGTGGAAGGAGGFRNQGAPQSGADGLPSGAGGGGGTRNAAGQGSGNGHGGAGVSGGAGGKCSGPGITCDGGGGGGGGFNAGGGGADGGGTGGGDPGSGGGGGGCLLPCGGAADVMNTFVGTSVPAQPGGASVRAAAVDPMVRLMFGTPARGRRGGGTPPHHHGGHPLKVRHHHHGNNNDPNPNTNPDQCNDPKRAPKACAPGRPH